MRYEDWDVLLFPRGLCAPVKEFSVACYVVHDTEFPQTQGVFGLPTLCCFVPSLPAGMPFQISIHSWSTPALSQFTKLYSMHPEDAKFEVRVFVDGQLVASTSLDRDTDGPHVIAHCFDFAKNGDLEPLKFPMFQKEILHQSFWDPADNLGRIKVVISEGFPRDSLSMPIERVKNIVAFSFQHAPLDILESSSIAWPNPSMWRRAPFTSSMPVPAYASEDAESHAHSPRRRTLGLPAASQIHGMPSVEDVLASGSVRQAPQDLCQANHLNKTTNGPLHIGSIDSFEDSSSYLEWLSGMDMNAASVSSQLTESIPKARRARKTSTDVSLPDFSSTRSGQNSMSGDGPFTLSSFQPEDGNSYRYLKAPYNTPTTRPDVSELRSLASTQSLGEKGVAFPITSRGSAISFDFADTLTSSLLNQSGPLPCRTPSLPGLTREPQSRKEALMRRATPSKASSYFSPSEDRTDREDIFEQISLPPDSHFTMSMDQSRTATPKSLNSSEIKVKTPSMTGYDDKMARKEEQENMFIEGKICDKSTKRICHVTPASAKASIQMDGIRQDSPRARLAPFTENTLANNAGPF